jgi:hypothetical protein
MRAPSTSHAAGWLKGLLPRCEARGYGQKEGKHMSEQRSRFDAARIDIFNDELGALVQKYLDMKDVDPLALYGPLWRRAKK